MGKIMYECHDKRSYYILVTLHLLENIGEI